MTATTATTAWCDEHAMPAASCGCATSEMRGHTYVDVDLTDTIAAVTAGTYVRPAPTLGRITGAGFMLYVARVHLVFGIGGSLKTWLSAYFLAERMLAGEHVMFVDFEDRPETLLARLIFDLGVPPEVIAEYLHYKRPAEPTHHGRDELLETVRRYGITVAVIDSFGESLATDGINPNADEEVAVWARLVARAIADEGAAVVLLDHLPKSDELALTPIGSQRKQAAIDGASYAMQIVKAPSREHAGHVRVVCGKDRQGAYSRGETVAELHLEPRDGHTVVTLRVPTARPTNADGTFRPTHIMERASLHVMMHPDCSTNDVIKGVGSKRDTVILALNTLVADGYIIRRPGPRNSHLFTSSKPYREADDRETSGEPDRVVTGPSLYKGETGRPVPDRSRETSGDQSETSCAGCGHPLDAVSISERRSTHAACGATS